MSRASPCTICWEVYGPTGHRLFSITKTVHIGYSDTGTLEKYLTQQAGNLERDLAIPQLGDVDSLPKDPVREP